MAVLFVTVLVIVISAISIKLGQRKQNHKSVYSVEHNNSNENSNDTDINTVISVI